MLFSFPAFLDGAVVVAGGDTCADAAVPDQKKMFEEEEGGS